MFNCKIAADVPFFIQLRVLDTHLLVLSINCPRWDIYWYLDISTDIKSLRDTLRNISHLRKQVNKPSNKVKRK